MGIFTAHYEEQANHYINLTARFYDSNDVWAQGLSRLFDRETEYNQEQLRASRKVWFVAAVELTKNYFTREISKDHKKKLETIENNIALIDRLEPTLGREWVVKEYQGTNEVNTTELEGYLPFQEQHEVLQTAYALASAELRRDGTHAYYEAPNSKVTDKDFWGAVSDVKALAKVVIGDREFGDKARQTQFDNAWARQSVPKF